MLDQLFFRWLENNRHIYNNDNDLALDDYRRTVMPLLVKGIRGFSTWFEHNTAYFNYNRNRAFEHYVGELMRGDIGIVRLEH